MVMRPATVLWQVHAHEPGWMPEDDFYAVCDWLRDNNALHLANADYDLAVVEKNGRREIRGRTEDGTPAAAPLVTDPPDIPRPHVPHLDQLQAALAKHRRAELPPGPLILLGDCLAEETAHLQPGGYYCFDCTQTRRAEVQYVAYPCKPVREAADLSGVTVW